MRVLVALLCCFAISQAASLGLGKTEPDVPTNTSSDGNDMLTRPREEFDRMLDAFMQQLANEMQAEIEKIGSDIVAMNRVNESDLADFYRRLEEAGRVIQTGITELAGGLDELGESIEKRLEKAGVMDDAEQVVNQFKDTAGAVHDMVVESGVLNTLANQLASMKCFFGCDESSESEPDSVSVETAAEP